MPSLSGGVFVLRIENSGRFKTVSMSFSLILQQMTQPHPTPTFRHKKNRNAVGVFDYHGVIGIERPKKQSLPDRK